MARRPHWYNSVRPGAEQVVPFDVALALQEERDLAVRHLERTREQLTLLQRDRAGLEERMGALQEALDEAQVELERAEEHARAQAARPREEPPPPPELAALKTRVVGLTEDLANVRRHTEISISRARSQERVARLRGLVEVHDAVLRSLEQSPDPESAWHKGNEVVLSRIRQELLSAGAQPIGNVGDAFDPRVCEAVASAPSPHLDPGTVVQVVESGFQLEDGTLVRPARVVVAG